MKRIGSFIFLSLLVTAGLIGQGKLIQTGDTNKRGLTDKDFPRVIKLADNVYAYEMIRPVTPGTDNERFTTNSLIVITSDGVLVADGQGSPADTQRLIEEIQKMTKQPIKYYVMGSEHGDHTGGNSVFPSSTVFISHPVAKANLERQANAPNRAANAPKVVVPTETVSDKRVLTMGKTEIQILNLGRAHTGSDLVVYLPKEKVLFMSEVYFHRLFPALRSGYPSEWIEAVKKAEKMDVNYYVAAHGFVDDAKTMKAELAEFRKALETVYAEAKRLYKPGGNAAEAFKQANLGPYATWASYAPMAQPSFQRVWDELDGKLK
jgi:cyclase